MPDELPPSSIRLIFEYDGNDVRLISQQPVDIFIPESDQPTTAAGHYAEVRDEAGDGLSRIPLRGAFDNSLEVFPEDHSQPITRVEGPHTGAFTVVVPAADAAATVALIRVEPSPDAEPGETGFAPDPAETVELGSFRLER